MTDEPFPTPTDAGLLVDLIRSVSNARFVADRDEAIWLLETAFRIHRSAGENAGIRRAFDSADRILAEATEVREQP
jgi:hypothetical protein